MGGSSCVQRLNRIRWQCGPRGSLSCENLTKSPPWNQSEARVGCPNWPRTRRNADSAPSLHTHELTPMCGIVGYVGKQEACPFLITGLRRLEYRGYDSAGIATLTNNGFQLHRSVGRIDRLVETIDRPMSGKQLGSGTLLATHGPATTENAHPHM